MSNTHPVSGKATHCPFVATPATTAALLVLRPAGSKEKPWPPLHSTATILIVRGSVLLVDDFGARDLALDASGAARLERACPKTRELRSSFQRRVVELAADCCERCVPDRLRRDFGGSVADRSDTGTRAAPPPA